MLRLESIVLQGFKSFADRTKLVFPLGITGIVGPNGCGKSNISDAIAWVLGEQSPKSLRGEKMGDVIFAGSPTRAASGHADVTMTWIKETPGPGAVERLEVARKLYKNGDSEYILNGRSCRLKDVQGALLDFGMGTKTYSIIEQGKVGQILSSKPTERRQLLEEAAGILKYKLRRHESQLKLRSAEENLQRLQDILAEVQKQRNHLKRQVGKARRYKLHKSRLREIDRSVLTYEIVHFLDSLRILQSEYRELNAIEQDTSKKVLKAEEDLRSRRAQSIQKEEEHRKYIDTAHETAKRLESTRQKAAFLEEKIKERNFNLQQFEAEKVKSREHQESLHEDLALCRKDLDHVEETLKQQTEELTRLLQNLKQQKSLVDEESNQERTLRQDLENTKKRLHGLEIENGQIIRQRSLLDSQLEEFLAGMKELKQEAASLNEQLVSIQDKNLKTADQLNKLRDDHGELTEQVRAAREKQKFNENLLRSEENKLQMLKNQRTNLENMLKARQDLSDSVRVVLKKADKQLVLLRDYLDSSHKYDTEAESLLGDLAQAFIIRDDADEKALQPFLAKSNIQVLDLRKSPSRVFETRKEAGLLSLNEALSVSTECPDHLQTNLKANLSWLVGNKAIILPEHPQETTPANLAIQHPELELVCHGDNTLYRANSMRVFKNKAQVKGFLTLKGEIKELVALEKQAHKVQEKTREETQKAIQQTQELESRLQAVTQSLNQVERQGDQYKAQIKHIENQLNQIQQRQDRDDRRANQLKESQVQIENRAKSIETERKSLCEAIESLELDFESKSNQIRGLRDSLQEHVNQEIRLKEKIDSAGVLKKRIEEEFSQLNGMLKTQRQNEATRESQIKQIQLELEQSIDTIASSKTEIKNLEGKLRSEESRVHDMDKNLNTERHDLDEWERKLSSLRDQRDDMRAKQGRFELEQARIQSELTHLKESYTLSQNEAFSGAKREDLLPEETIEELKKERSDIKRKLSELGTVNLLAVEEYDEIEARYEFLINQQKDLVDSIAEIRSTIRTLNKESVTRFLKAFEEVNRIFQDTFVALFGGGQARLELLDEENVLDSGIDMIIQPPGKKLQNAMLLSGGEKALAATALLFSIFEYRPSPFCLLDEVDAPLDEANVMRLTKKLDIMKQRTQFIMITHHKSTMAIASSLFGVTMEENGCSKIVSVQFS